MTLNWKHALVAGAILTVVPGLARAHELTCDKTVNGEGQIELDSYPSFVDWLIRINNVHPNAPSVVLSVTDSLNPTFEFNPAPPFAIPVNGYVEDGYGGGIQSYQLCLFLASLDGRVDNYIDNTARVTWDLGEAQCSARIVCSPPEPPCEGPDCPCEGPNCPPPESDTTRTRGFFMTHISAMQQCLAAGGPIALGDLATITTIEDALGILWGSVPRFPDDTFRNAYERARFQLAVQTLVGVCNVRLFGSTPDPANLITTALGLLDAPYTCSQAYRDQVLATQGLMDTYNNSGDAEPFPGGFVPGPATPQAAQDLAADPTSPDGVCP